MCAECRRGESTAVKARLLPHKGGTRLGGRQPSLIPEVKNVQREAALAALGANWEDYKHNKHTPMDHKRWHFHPAQILSVCTHTNTQHKVTFSSPATLPMGMIVVCLIQSHRKKKTKTMARNQLNNEAEIRGFT